MKTKNVRRQKNYLRQSLLGNVFLKLKKQGIYL